MEKGRNCREGEAPAEPLGDCGFYRLSGLAGASPSHDAVFSIPAGKSRMKILHGIARWGFGIELFFQEMASIFSRLQFKGTQ